MNESQKGWLLFAVIAVFIAGVAWWFFSSRTSDALPESTSTSAEIAQADVGGTPAAEDTAAGATGASHLGMPLPEQTEGVVKVENQSPGASVAVTEVVLEVDGWLVVHEVNNGLIGNALGALRRDAGSYEALSIDLLRETEPRRTYALILYRDDGNRTFEIRVDPPMVDTTGEPLVQTFETL